MCIVHAQCTLLRDSDEWCRFTTRFWFDPLSSRLDSRTVVVRERFTYKTDIVCLLEVRDSGQTTDKRAQNRDAFRHTCTCIIM